MVLQLSCANVVILTNSQNFDQPYTKYSFLQIKCTIYSQKIIENAFPTVHGMLGREEK
jgi:hypothetical protein